MFDSPVKNHKIAEQTVKDTKRDETEVMYEFNSLQKFTPTESSPKGGLYHNWGLQAMTDLVIGKAAVKRLGRLVPHTLVPIIKLCGENREDIAAAYDKILEQNENANFLDSPRERYRKIYGNFVRELEWSCSELRKYFTKSAYEDLIISTTADYIKEVLGPFVTLLNKMIVLGKEQSSKLPTQISDQFNKVAAKITGKIFEDVFNITGWLVGKVRITEFDIREGTMVMMVDDCLLLRAPRMKDLPEESCLLGCKGGCEKIFSGEDSPLKMVLDARLPETSCEIRIFLNEKK